MSIITDFVGDRLPPDLYQAYLAPLFDACGDELLAASPPSGKALDIACGTGIISRKLAARDEVEYVEAIDIAPPMIEKARALTGSGAPIRFEVASAQQLPFEDDAFSGAYCQQGLQFFPDRTAALREFRRVVAPGGKIAVAVWTAASDGNPVFAAFEEIVASELGADLLPFGPFSFGDGETLERTADDAGLKVLSLEKREFVAPLCDARTLVLFDLLFLGRPGPDGALQPLFDPGDDTKDSLIERLISRLEEATAQYRQSDGKLLAPAATHILVAESS